MREREVLRLRFEEDLTQSEIGIRVGLSQMQASRLLSQSITLRREEADGRDAAVRKWAAISSRTRSAGT